MEFGIDPSISFLKDFHGYWEMSSARSLVRESDPTEELTDREVLRVMQPKTLKLYEISLIMLDKVYI